MNKSPKEILDAIHTSNNYSNMLFNIYSKNGTSQQDDSEEDDEIDNGDDTYIEGSQSQPNQNKSFASNFLKYLHQYFKKTSATYRSEGIRFKTLKEAKSLMLDDNISIVSKAHIYHYAKFFEQNFNLNQNDIVKKWCNSILKSISTRDKPTTLMQTSEEAQNCKRLLTKKSKNIVTENQMLDEIFEKFQNEFPQRDKNESSKDFDFVELSIINLILIISIIIFYLINNKFIQISKVLI
ncbi:hypothetical protein ABPG74_005155 [Tetrahymena malaccensis]